MTARPTRGEVSYDPRHDGNHFMNRVTPCFRMLCLVLVTALLSLACDSSSNDSPSSPSQTGTTLVIREWTVLVTGGFAGMGLLYSFGGTIEPNPPGSGVRVVSMEVTVRGTDGQSYFTWVNPSAQSDVGLGRSGGFGNMSDPVVGRAAASTFTARIVYSVGGRTSVAERSGSVVRIP